MDEWLKWGRNCQHAGCRLLALVPCAHGCVPAVLRQVYSVHSWQRDPNYQTKDRQTRADLILQVMTLAAPVARLEPGLLRALRLLIPDAYDASLEAEIWHSRYLSSNHHVAATIDQNWVNELLPRFEILPEDIRRDALITIRNWRVLRQNAPGTVATAAIGSIMKNRGYE